MTVILQQWASFIRSSNQITKSHIDTTLSKIDSNLFKNNVYVKYELHEDGDLNTVTVYGYGNRNNDDVKMFMRAFRKYLRLHGHVLDGNIWLYGEKEIIPQENNVINNINEPLKAENDVSI